MNTRKEHDLLGAMDVPAAAYWGIHTARALQNFTLTQRPVCPELIRALAYVKKACAQANLELQFLPPPVAQALEQACDEIIAGGWLEQFPLDELQGGAGTSANMNMNEVLANRALEIMGHARGAYDIIHPLEHVNRHQSTNDVFPTAIKVAAIFGGRALSRELEILQGALQEKERAWAGHVKLGRTELQDAVPMTLGAEFSAFAEAIGRDRWRTHKCEERLRYINLGGTAIGTGLAAPRAYIFLATEKLRNLTGLSLARAENLVDATANADAFVEADGMLAALGANLIKICRDLRLLHYFGEIRLPPVQAGSSIMPGKVNPVILEAVIAAALRARANHTLVLEAAALGSFQINEWLPLLAAALLESLRVLEHAVRLLAAHITGSEAQPRPCRDRMNASPLLITACLPAIGYEKAEQLLLEFQAGGADDFRGFLEKRLGTNMVEKMLDPAQLVKLGFG